MFIVGLHNCPALNDLYKEPQAPQRYEHKIIREFYIQRQESRFQPILTACISDEEEILDETNIPNTDEDYDYSQENHVDDHYNEIYSEGEGEITLTQDDNLIANQYIADFHDNYTVCNYLLIF
jgi:hypothetical protein